MSGGWAQHPWREHPRGAADGGPAPFAVWTWDMPLGRPNFRRPHIKGVPEVSASDGDGTWDEDYQPGGGLPWQPL